MSWLLAGLFFVQGAAAATRSYTDEELCRLANWIVIATVQTRQPMWLDLEQTTILTKVTLRVEATIVGDPGSTVSVSTLGGTIGDTAQVVGEEPPHDIPAMTAAWKAKCD